jgi:hypothetical protein
VKKGNGKEKRGGGGVALKRALAERLGKREAVEGVDYSAVRVARPIETFEAGRKCKCCGCFLAASNPDKFCRPCDRAIQEWRNFPWRRGELEQEMGQHCLDYVRKHYTGKKAVTAAKGCCQ